jgi:hypothetical protein
MLQTLVRGALAFFLALTGLVIATEAPAFACKCQAADADRQTRRSDVVFVGTVDRETSVTSAAQAAACGLGELKVGKDYVFLARGDAPPYAASSCEGSGPANADRVTQLETLLGAGTAIEEPAPPTATRTRVEESAPGTFARLAAPGGALVLFGLLGLLVVGRLGKR